MTTDDLDDLLTVPEIAPMLGVSRMTVYRLVESRQLGALRVGRSIRVPRAALNDYLTAAQVKP